MSELIWKPRCQHLVDFMEFVGKASDEFGVVYNARDHSNDLRIDCIQCRLTIPLWMEIPIGMAAEWESLDAVARSWAEHQERCSEQAANHAAAAYDAQRVTDTIACVDRLIAALLSYTRLTNGCPDDVRTAKHADLRTAFLDLAGIPLDAPGR